MSLNDWARNGWLTAHTTSADEIRELLAVVERDLADSSVAALSPEWRLSIAYNAALQASTAALAAAGYRAARDSHHFRVIESLALTIGADAKLTATFDAYRKKRNISGYERVGMVSEGAASPTRRPRPHQHAPRRPPRAAPYSQPPPDHQRHQRDGDDQQ